MFGSVSCSLFIIEGLMSNSTTFLICPACDYEEPFESALDACPHCGYTFLDTYYKTEDTFDWPNSLAQRTFDMWRYHELLPLRDLGGRVSLGEGGTPLVKAVNVGTMLGLSNLYIKDERQGPTGSFKDRQAALAISVMREHGIGEVVVASTGNVAIAYGAYCARAGIKLWAFLTSLVPADKMREVAIYGTEVVKVTGTYDQTKQIAASFAEARGLHLDRGLRSIAAKESMKTVAFEIAEQLGMLHKVDRQGILQSGGKWRAPDWYIQAVSGGLGPIGVMRGFSELKERGLIDSLPKLACVQSAGCDPMVQSWKANHEEPIIVNNPHTRIATLATGNPGEAYKILRGLTLEHGGLMESVTDEEAFKALHQMAKLDGFSMEPAAAVAFAGLFKMVRRGHIDSDETVVINCSGHTFPVEKQLLGEEWERSIDVTPAARQLPEEGLLAALSHIDKRVSRVLVIEDNADAARLIERVIQAHGNYEVLHAADGKSGLQMASSLLPDLIMLDLMMPDMDGFGVLDALKSDQALHDVPVIVVTAKDLTTHERELLNDRVESLLRKGSFIDEGALQDILEQLN